MTIDTVPFKVPGYLPGREVRSRLTLVAEGEAHEFHIAVKSQREERTMIHEGLPARSGPPLAALARQALDDLEGNHKMARQRLARNKASQ